MFCREALTSARVRFTLARMADKPGYYWDLDECGWVRSPKPVETVDVPAQSTGIEPMGLESEQEADVRSG